MIRYLLRWMMILSGVLLLPILLIRAQPYDDSKLRAFLTPPKGCPAPCFMGIRPGVTTTEEAIAILEDHEWLPEIINVVLTDEITLFWDVQSEASLHGNWSGSIRTKDNIVQDIGLSRYNLGEVFAAYGPPEWAKTTRVFGSSGTPGVSYLINYGRNLPEFRVFVPARSWFGKLHFVLDTDLGIYYGLDGEADMMENPSLLDFIVTAENF